MKLSENLFLNRYNWASSVINRISSSLESTTIFDIGARDAILKNYLKGDQFNYYGFDLYPLDASLRAWNIESNFPYNDAPADIISLLEVVEHLQNPWLAFKNLGNTLKKDGFLLLTTPNPGWSRSRFSLLAKGNLTCFTQNDLDVNHHVFTPWPHVVERLLTDNGFKIIEYVTLDGKTGLFTKPITLRYPLQLLNRLANVIVEKLDASSCGMSYGILAQKIK